jgi:hypothetical protein
MGARRVIGQPPMMPHGAGLTNASRRFGRDRGRAPRDRARVRAAIAVSRA